MYALRYASRLLDSHEYFRYLPRYLSNYLPTYSLQIWINTQKEELIRRTNFDVSQRSDWWPAFGRQISPPVNSVQPDSIEYTLTSDTDVHLLQDKIEKFLRDSIMKWRPTSRYLTHLSRLLQAH